MTAKDDPLLSFLRFFGVNLLAVYLPSLPWMACIAPPSNWTYVYFPVGLVGIFLRAGEVGAFTVLLLALAVLSQVGHSMRFRWIIPGVIATASFIQGALVVYIVSGLKT